LAYRLQPIVRTPAMPTCCPLRESDDVGRRNEQEPLMSQIRSIQGQARSRQAALARETAHAVRRNVLDALLRVSLAADSGDAPLRLAPAATATAPEQLAAAQTVDQVTRHRLVGSYEQCLRTYRDIARTQAPDTTDDDLGAALAFYVAVNLHALHGVDVGSGVMVLLERQLRGVSRRASSWDSASLAQRQAFFERIAILAILVSGSCATAAAQGPAAVAKVRRAARQYLQQMLGLNPDLLTLGPTGLVARGRTAPAGACAAARTA
jgi:hypothetical protein